MTESNTTSSNADPDVVVVGADGAQAARWSDAISAPAWSAATCLYFVAPRAPITQPVLILNGDGEGPINNLCFPTRVSTDYGSGDADLASVTVVGGDAPDPALLATPPIAPHRR